MKSILCFIMVLASALYGSENNGTEQSFSSFRLRAAKIKPYSQEDYQLGRELLAAIQKQAKMHKPVLERPYAFARFVQHRAGSLYACTYLRPDRELFGSRTLWEKSNSDFKSVSYMKTIEICKNYELDGFSGFIFPKDLYERQIKIVYDSLLKMDTGKGKFTFMPVYSGHLQNFFPDPKSAELFASSPYSFQVNGNPVAVSYFFDNFTPEEIEAKLAQLKKLTGKDTMLVTQIRFMHLKDNGNIYYSKNEVSAIQLLHIFDYLTSYLKVSGGLSIGEASVTSANTLNEKYYHEVLYPLFEAVFAQDEFNGKKLLVNELKTGYYNYEGGQSLSRDGTKTLRKYLDFSLKYKTDIMLMVEWDETNEDTGFVPLLGKPMSTQRIFKYYMSLLKHQEPAPNPDDDLSLPNLIISQRCQLMPGWVMDVELLNVPDTLKGEPYTVCLELLDQNDKTVFKSGPVSFNTAELKDKTFYLPSENFADSQALQSRLTIDYQGKKTVIGEGLPFTVMRTTTCWQHSYYCTPLRNILRGINAKVSFSRPSGNSHELKLDASLKANELLNTIEAVQDNFVTYAYDPLNEYFQNDQDRMLFKFSWNYVNNPNLIPIAMDVDVKNAPSAKTFTTFNWKTDPGAVRKSSSAYSETNNDIWMKNHAETSADDNFRYSLISIKKEDLDKGIFEIHGTRLDGASKGEKFAWQIPFKKLNDDGINSKVFHDGLAFVMETVHKPLIVPLPLAAEKVQINTVFASDNPSAVIALRVISEKGKVYWSKPFSPLSVTAVGDMPIQVYSEDKGAVSLSVPSNRVPDIKYLFNPRFGNILYTSAGREFYGYIGSYVAVATGFSGLSYLRGFTPQYYLRPDGNNSPPAVWEKLPDGKWALKFDGENSNFLLLSSTAVPCRAGFTLSFDIMPEIIKPYQILFEQQRPRYLSGFRIAVKNGKLNIEFRRRVPHDKSISYCTVPEFQTEIPIYAGQWQKIVFKYDETKIVVSANGKTETFPCSGIGLKVLCVSSFGGHRTEKENFLFNGLLRELEIKHSAR